MNSSDVRSETSLMLTIAIIALITVATIVTYVKSVCSAPSPVLLETLPALREPAGSTGRLETVSLDQAGIRAPGRRVLRMRSASALELRGWAVDPVALRPAAGVFAVVDDGRAFRATYVSNALTHLPVPVPSGSSGGGFSVAVQSSEIGAGAHRVELRVIASDRSGYYRLAPVLRVVVR